MCVRCEIDDAVSDYDWDRLVQIADDLRAGRRTLDDQQEVSEGDPRWTDAWLLVDEIAGWIEREMDVELTLWQKRLLFWTRAREPQ